MHPAIACLLTAAACVRPTQTVKVTTVDDAEVTARLELAGDRVVLRTSNGVLPPATVRRVTATSHGAGAAPGLAVGLGGGAGAGAAIGFVGGAVGIVVGPDGVAWKF